MQNVQAGALEMAGRRQTVPGRVTVFTDAQAACD